MSNQNWWEESPQEFADGFTEEKTHGVNLGQHRAMFSEATGKLTILSELSSIVLSADETYRLLIWLHDNFRDGLYEKTHTAESEQDPASKRKPGRKDGA